MDNLGFGCTQKYDKQWVAHQDSFNDLLAGLSAESTTTTETTGECFECALFSLNGPSRLETSFGGQGQNQ